MLGEELLQKTDLGLLEVEDYHSKEVSNEAVLTPSPTISITPTPTSIASSSPSNLPQITSNSISDNAFIGIGVIMSLAGLWSFAVYRGWVPAPAMNHYRRFGRR